jgi:hypothetical protein
VTRSIRIISPLHIEKVFMAYAFLLAAVLGGEPKISWT